MYNDDRKTTFINSHSDKPSFRVLMQRTFSLLSESESKLQKDVCEFSKAELDSALKDVVGVRKNGASEVYKIVKYYRLWCKNTGISTSDDDFSAGISDEALAENMQDKMVCSSKDLKVILDKVFKNCESNTIEYIYRCFLWMAFMGLRDTEAMNVVRNDVSFNTMEISYFGGCYKIPQESAYDFKMCCSMRNFEIPIGRGHKVVMRAPGDRILRGGELTRISNVEKALSSLFRPTIAHKMSAAGITPISYNRIRLSGIFSRAYEYEKESGESYDFAKETDNEYHFKTGKSITMTTSSKVKAKIKKDFVTDYEIWKKAFSDQLK